MNFLAVDKISCPGQKDFCQGQYFLSETKWILPLTKDILSVCVLKVRGQKMILLLWHSRIEVSQLNLTGPHKYFGL